MPSIGWLVAEQSPTDKLANVVYREYGRHTEAMP